MGYRIGATAVLLLHLCFIIFVVGGAGLALRRRWIIRLHLPALAWAVLVEVTNYRCPLTDLENALRVRGGLAGYGEDFVGHCLLSTIYPAQLTRSMQFGLAAFVVLVNACLYTAVWRTYRRRRRVAQTGSSEVPPADEP